MPHPMSCPAPATLRSAALAAVSVVLLSGCTVAADGLFAPEGPITQAQADRLRTIIALVSVVVVPLYLGVPLVLWRYRMGRGGEYRPDWRWSTPAEFVIWGIPLAIVAILAFGLWRTIDTLDPYARVAPGGMAPLRIQAVSLDWKWLFIYPEEGVASVNELVVPQGREVAFDLTADGPMTSFIVPRLGGQIYAMAGMRTRMHLPGARAGDYRGRNTQFNGTHYSQQNFVMRVRPDADYRAWVARTRAARPLDNNAYSRLRKPSVVPTPLGFGQPQPALFGRIMAAYGGHKMDMVR